MLAPTAGRRGADPYDHRELPPQSCKRLWEGTGGYGGVLGEAELEGWETTHIRPEGTPLFFFILYSLMREGRPLPYKYGDWTPPLNS